MIVNRFKKNIKIKFQNGLSFNDFKTEVLDINYLDEYFNFIESEQPDFIIFGPYGNEIPEKSSNYIRVGYFCENIRPDFSCCEWAFGIPRETDINHSRYKRIQWHGLEPKSLLKNLTDNEIDRIISLKNKFCNFLYSNPVFYREEFFKQLSKYKKIDAPGKSMNNMLSIDKIYNGSFWDRKRAFLKSYKFTIAFESYSYPGYQTEKLYDAMQVNSIPIYCGDPYIGEIFNTNSFVNVPDHTLVCRSTLVKFAELTGQQTFNDYRPQFYKSPFYRIKRKTKTLIRNQKMNIQFNNLNFSDIIDQIITIDKNEDLYIQYLKQPWFKQNQLPQNTNNRETWLKIFNS